MSSDLSEFLATLLRIARFVLDVTLTAPLGRKASDQVLAGGGVTPTSWICLDRTWKAMYEFPSAQKLKLGGIRNSSLYIYIYIYPFSLWRPRPPGANSNSSPRKGTAQIYGVPPRNTLQRFEVMQMP